MSRERLQEHFSALHDGTLDAGLTQQIQKRFETDRELKADYDEFCMLMNLLGEMPDEQIDVPASLASKIADRLDASVATKPAFSWFGMSKTLGFGSLAAVALVASVIALNSRNKGPVQASIVPEVAAKPAKVLDSVLLAAKGKEAVLTYHSSGPKTLVVTFLDGGQELKKVDLNGNSADYVLENAEVAPAVYEVSVTGEKLSHVVIVPGSSTAFDLQSEGKLLDFAKGISAKYGKILHLQVPAEKLSANLKWDVKAEDANSALGSVLEAKDYSISTESDGILTVISH